MYFYFSCSSNKNEGFQQTSTFSYSSNKNEGFQQTFTVSYSSNKNEGFQQTCTFTLAVTKRVFKRHVLLAIAVTTNEGFHDQVIIILVFHDYSKYD